MYAIKVMGMLYCFVSFESESLEAFLSESELPCFDISSLSDLSELPESLGGLGSPNAKSSFAGGPHPRQRGAAVRRVSLLR